MLIIFYREKKKNNWVGLGGGGGGGKYIGRENEYDYWRVCACVLSVLSFTSLVRSGGL